MDNFASPRLAEVSRVDAERVSKFPTRNRIEVFQFEIVSLLLMHYACCKYGICLKQDFILFQWTRNHNEYF